MGALRGRCLQRLSTLLACSVGWCTLWVGARGDDWTFFRGPHFNGHGDDRQLVEQWPNEGPPVLWTREAGTGYSSFVAWDKRVATQWQTLSGQYVVCLDADTGDTVWEYRYDWPYLPASVYPGPRATPTYAQGRLYFAAPDGLIGCLQADDGSLLWSVNVTTKFQGQGTGFGYSCSPLVIDDKVVLPVGGVGASMMALDAITGEVVWQAGDDPASYASALPITFRDQLQVIGYLQNTLVCHDLRTGERLWRYYLSDGYDEHSAWPIYSEPFLWIAKAFRGGCEQLELTGEESAPVRLVWQSDLLSNDILSSVLADGALFGFDVRDAQAKSHRPTRGSFRCLDFADGQPLWSNGNETIRPTQTPEPAGDKPVGHASVLVADGKLIMLNDTGELILARATRSRYEELARTTILGGEIGWTQPALHRGRIYARNQSRAVCVYLGDLAQLDQRARAAAVPASQITQPVYRNWAAWILGIEPEYAFDIPGIDWLVAWYLVAWPGILGVCWLLALLAQWNARVRQRVGAQSVFWTMAFLLGVTGTTFLSRWRGDFLFTWPVALFVAFEAVIYQLDLSRDSRSASSGRWRSRLVVAFFLITCLAYFLVCRRLSLVFEWVFLCGFAAAVPFSVAGAHCCRQRSWSWAWRIGMTSLAFAAFYWSSVLVLLWKAH